MAPSSTRAIDAPAGFVPFDLSDTAQSITSRFEKVARTWPDRLAVQSGGMSWTYAELDEAASRIAFDIRRAAPTAPQPVALLLGQGPRLLASILGILKAGHFYVPLDATHPRPAIARILQDCGARLIVTDSARHPVAADVSASSAGPVHPAIVNADLARGHFKGIVSSVRVKPDALACIYYTSGTTGRPKGVMDTHRNVLHNVMRYTNGLGINPDDRLSLLQSPTFSGVMSSQFGALLNGAAVFPYDIQAEGLARIASWLLEERITIYHSVPAIFRHMLRAASGPQQFPDIRVVRLEGDGASLTDVALFNEHFPKTSVLAHGLGATECGLVCRFVIENGMAVPGGNVPVGYPVEDMRVRVLDDQRNEVRAGEIGEIAVESRYLSPGYWKRPDLTLAAFTAGVMPGTRLYRTGDLGRLAPDGCVEHLGRKDGQAKVRGQRIDVEGVEAAIVSTKLVREAVVIVRPSSGRDARLTAYVVPNDGGLSTSSLRRQLTHLLPPQSVPSRFVCLPALPLTANHKLDRAALPGVTSVRPALEVPYVAPRTDLERTLASIWEVTLDVASIGVLDDFFDLGGDSLDAAAMLARFSAKSGRTLPPAALFEAPTIERLARLIDGAAVDGAGGPTDGAPRIAEQAPLVRVQPNGSRAPFFFLHAEYGGTGSYLRERGPSPRREPAVLRAVPVRPRRRTGSVQHRNDGHGLSRRCPEGTASRPVLSRRLLQRGGRGVGDGAPARCDGSARRVARPDRAAIDRERLDGARDPPGSPRGDPPGRRPRRSREVPAAGHAAGAPPVAPQASAHHPRAARAHRPVRAQRHSVGGPERRDCGDVSPRRRCVPAATIRRARSMSAGRR